MRSCFPSPACAALGVAVALFLFPLAARAAVPVFDLELNRSWIRDFQNDFLNTRWQRDITDGLVKKEYEYDPEQQKLVRQYLEKANQEIFASFERGGDAGGPRHITNVQTFLQRTEKRATTMFFDTLQDGAVKQALEKTRVPAPAPTLRQNEPEATGAAAWDAALQLADPANNPTMRFFSALRNLSNKVNEAVNANEIIAQQGGGFLPVREGCDDDLGLNEGCVIKKPARASADIFANTVASDQRSLEQADERRELDTQIGRPTIESVGSLRVLERGTGIAPAQRGSPVKLPERCASPPCASGTATNQDLGDALGRLPHDDVLNAYDLQGNMLCTASPCPSGSITREEYDGLFDTSNISEEELNAVDVGGLVQPQPGVSIGPPLETDGRVPQLRIEFTTFYNTFGNVSAQSLGNVLGQFSRSALQNIPVSALGHLVSRLPNSALGELSRQVMVEVVNQLPLDERSAIFPEQYSGRGLGTLPNDALRNAIGELQRTRPGAFQEMSGRTLGNILSEIPSAAYTQSRDEFLRRALAEVVFSAGENAMRTIPTDALAGPLSQMPRETLSLLLRGVSQFAIDELLRDRPQSRSNATAAPQQAPVAIIDAAIADERAYRERKEETERLLAGPALPAGGPTADGAPGLVQILQELITLVRNRGQRNEPTLCIVDASLRAQINASTSYQQHLDAARIFSSELDQAREQLRRIRGPMLVPALAQIPVGLMPDAGSISVRDMLLQNPDVREFQLVALGQETTLADLLAEDAEGNVTLRQELINGTPAVVLRAAIPAFYIPLGDIPRSMFFISSLQELRSRAVQTNMSATDLTAATARIRARGNTVINLLLREQNPDPRTNPLGSAQEHFEAANASRSRRLLDLRNCRE